MYNNETRLIDLTVRDLKEIISETISNIQADHSSVVNKIEKPISDIIYLDEAAKIVGVSKNTIYSKVCRMEMPYVSRGRPLTFSRKQIEEWIMNGRPNFIETKVDEHLANLKGRKRK